MHWFQALDTALFHFINGRLSNPVFDWLMPVLSGAGEVMRLFNLTLLVLGITVLIRGGARARICVFLLFIAVVLGDHLIVDTLKDAIARPRPCLTLPHVTARLPCPQSESMPSGHAANWFAAAMILFLFYRRSGWFMFPLAAAVAFSRVYCGVHYPSDVAVGAILGGGYAIALAVAAQGVWNFFGRKWFPLWHQRLPNVLNPKPASATYQPADVHSHWFRLGGLLIIVALMGRWIYLASGFIGLSGDEAYQWIWSKHLALSYFSKPPAIAYIQWAGTAIAGDTNLGVRFFSPVFAAILGWIVLKFLSREIGGRNAFLLLLITFATPLLIAGSILMTIDPPLVLCWMWSVIAGWRALQPEGKTRDWIIAGIAAGLAFLSKYSAMFLPICWVFYFVLQPASRHHLRKPGPWLALGLLLLSTVPVLVWNAQHGWITVHHVANNAGFYKHKHWHPTLKYFGEFLGAEAGLLNPVFFIGFVWASFACWKRRRERPLLLYLFYMGAPVFYGYWLYSFHSRVLANWIAPSVPPLFCLMAIYWTERRVNLKPWLATGLTLGLVMSAFMHDSDLLGKFINALPGDKDPTHRVRGWRQADQMIEAEREKFDSHAFIIAENYATTGLFSFYSPRARAAVKTDTPLVYCIHSDHPANQFYFWDSYNYLKHRQGQNAIFVVRLQPYKLESGWFWKWLQHDPIHYAKVPPPRPVSRQIASEFESTTNLGTFDVKLKDGRIFQRLEIFGCYHLK